MLKLEKAMKDSGFNLNTLSYHSGARSRYRSLERLFNNECAISDLSLELLTEVAGIMGKSLVDILEPFDVDGTTGRIENIKRVIERIRKRLYQITDSDILNNSMVIQINKDQTRFNDSEINLSFIDNENVKSGTINKPGNNSKSENSGFYNKPAFVMAINVDRLEFGDGFINNPYPYNKTDYDLLNSNEALPDITNLNEAFQNEQKKRGKWSKSKYTDSLTINSQSNIVINESPAMIVYTPLKGGGDLKFVVTVLDKRGNTRFTEIYGVEWIDKEKDKRIAYYKSHYKEPFNKTNIKKAIKNPISEAEYFRGIHSQFNKFKISK